MGPPLSNQGVWGSSAGSRGAGKYGASAVWRGPPRPHRRRSRFYPVEDMERDNAAERVEQLLQQGAALRYSGNLQQALICFAQAQQLAPTNVVVLNALGGLMGQMGRVNDAIEVFTLATGYAPEMAELHFNRAVSLQNARRMD